MSHPPAKLDHPADAAGQRRDAPLALGRPAGGHDAEYAATLDAMFDPVHVVTADLRITLINAAFSRWMARLGLAPAVAGQPLFEIFPFLPARVREEYQHVLEQGEPVVTQESTGVAGRTYHTETRKLPIKRDGSVVRVVTVVHDITDLKNAELALRHSEENYRLLVEASPLAICVHEEGRIAFANPAAVELLGAQSPTELLGRAFLELLEPEYHEAVVARIRHVRSGKPAPALEERFRRLDGGVIDVSAVATPLCFQGKPAVQVVFSDITEQKRAAAERRRLDQQLQQAQKLESLGVLAGGIAHDFNNLLTAILGRLSLAARGVSDPGTIRDLSEANRAGEQAVALTKQLLTFARGGAPVRVLGRLGPLARETAEFCLHGSRLRTEFSLKDRAFVAIDAGQMRQVVQNLVLNAKDSMPEGGTIRVCTEDVVREERRWVRLEVSDSGRGIPEDDRPRVFDPYFTTKPTGSGLGLAVAHSVVRKHEGAIEVRSEIGAGTTFTVYLPAASGAPGPRSEAPPSRPGRALRVLVMDDEPDVRAVLADMLERAGHLAVCVREGAEAVVQYRSALGTAEPFHAVLLDLTVPGGMAGMEAAAALRQVDPSVRLVVSSGYSEDPVMARFADHGFAAALAKPYGIAQLLAALARATEPTR